MPMFKSTHNILKDPAYDEVWDNRFLDSDNPYLPPTKDWDYKRELRIEDVDIWEIIWESSGGRGVYASWRPYAEFYMIKTGWKLQKIGKGIETYYGAGSQNLVIKRMIELGFPVNMFSVWIEDHEQWLYHVPESEKVIYSFGL